MDKLGFLLLILGCAGMDSPNQIIPVIIASTGLLIIVVSVLKEKRSCPAPTKAMDKTNKNTLHRDCNTGKRRTQWVN